MGVVQVDVGWKQAGRDSQQLPSTHHQLWTTRHFLLSQVGREKCWPFIGGQQEMTFLVPFRGARNRTRVSRDQTVASLRWAQHSSCPSPSREGEGPNGWKLTGDNFRQTVSCVRLATVGKTSLVVPGFLEKQFVESRHRPKVDQRCLFPANGRLAIINNRWILLSFTFLSTIVSGGTIISATHGRPPLTVEGKDKKERHSAANQLLKQRACNP